MATKLTKAQVEKIILDFRKEGKSGAQIGTILKEKHNIYDVKKTLGKKMAEFLKEKSDLKVPEDLENLSEHTKIMEKHVELNKKDFITKRRLELKSAKARKLAKYYKRKGTLDASWKL